VRSGAGELIYDHAVPLKYLQDELLNLDNPTTSSLAEALNRHSVVVLITKNDDRCLNKAGYRSKMPEGWDGVDQFARYKAVGIEVVPNTRSPKVVATKSQGRRRRRRE
jgi:hypothetical protein